MTQGQIDGPTEKGGSGQELTWEISWAYPVPRKKGLWWNPELTTGRLGGLRRARLQAHARPHSQLWWV